MHKYIKILPIILIFVFSLSCCLKAQDVAESSPSAEPELTVLSIEVKGNKTISTNTIISKMKTRSGSPYLENVISDDLKRLYLTGFFSDIKIDKVKYRDGVKVIVTVVEKPVIEKISFEGMRRLHYIKDEKLKESLKSKEGQVLDRAILKEDVQTMRDLYQKKGFRQALFY